MKEERIYQVSRWLLALAAVIIPLSIFVLISGPFSANYLTRQWTRYMLFASWICWTISLIAGIVNILGFFFTETSGIKEGQSAGGEDEGIGEPESVEKAPVAEKEGKGDKESSALWSASLMGAQAAFFMTGVLLYVAFCAYMLLPYLQR